MEDKIKKFLNEIFAGKTIDARLIEDRQRLKKALLEKIEECRAENMDEELIFDEAVSRLEGLPEKLPSNENASEKGSIKEGVYSVNLNLIFKIFFLAAVAIAEICYIAFSWISGVWHRLAPLAFIPLILTFGMYAGKRLYWNFTKKRHSVTPALLTVLYGCLVFTIVFFLFAAIPAADFYITLIGLAATVPLAGEILCKVFLKKSCLPASLVFIVLIAGLVYMLIKRFLPEFKYVWIIFIAAAIIDGIMVFASLPLKRK